MSYRITHEIKPGCQAIIFEFDQDSQAELFRDFSQQKHLHKYAWRHRRNRLWSVFRYFFGAAECQS